MDRAPGEDRCGDGEVAEPAVGATADEDLIEPRPGHIVDVVHVVDARVHRHLGSQPLCVDDERPPFAFVLVEGTASLSEDPAELLDTATRIGARYMGAERAEEYGKRNGVPGELTVRIKATKVISSFKISD